MTGLNNRMYSVAIPIDSSAFDIIDNFTALNITDKTIRTNIPLIVGTLNIGDGVNGNYIYIVDGYETITTSSTASADTNSTIYLTELNII